MGLDERTGDRSCGYETVAEAFIALRSQSGIGVATVREWARGLPDKAAVLDLGCGNGIPVSAALIEAGFDVCGVDASPSMVAAFRERFPTARVECAAAQDAALLDRRFDGIVAWGLIFLLDSNSQIRLFERIAAALRPRGRFLFTAPGPACQWHDNLTGRVSCSLGASAYRRILGTWGLVVEREVDDEGGNHHYFVRATDRRHDPGGHGREIA